MPVLFGDYKRPIPLLILQAILLWTSSTSAFNTSPQQTPPSSTPPLLLRPKQNEFIKALPPRKPLYETKNQEIIETGNVSNRAAAFSFSAHNLVWSPGFWKKMVVSLFVLVATRTLLGESLSWITQMLSPRLQPLMELLVLPLLSSACCGIQILINVAVGASGCAGFNKYLGPIRPYFLAILVDSTLVRRQVQPIIYKVLGMWFLAMLPELVHASNTMLSAQRSKRNAASDGKSVQATITLRVPTMGCVACISKINSSLRNVDSTESHLSPEGGGGQSIVQVSVDSKTQLDSVADMLVEQVRNAGFDGCTVESIQVA